MIPARCKLLKCTIRIEDAIFSFFFFFFTKVKIAIIVSHMYGKLAIPVTGRGCL
jgi:hypothetical protein